MPLSGDEAHGLIKINYEEDEPRAVKVLEQGHSVSGSTFQKIGLTRRSIQQALSRQPSAI